MLLRGSLVLIEWLERSIERALSSLFLSCIDFSTHNIAQWFGYPLDLGITQGIPDLARPGFPTRDVR